MVLLRLYESKITANAQIDLLIRLINKNIK